MPNFKEHSEKLDCAKYKTVSICSWFINNFIELSEKFKWFTNIRYIIMHSHDFNKDIKLYSSCFDNYRSIFIESNEYKELIVGNSSNPLLDKSEFFQKQKSAYNWAARVYSSFELVGLSSKDNNALILKGFSGFCHILTFEIKWIANEWILLKIEDLYWKVELCSVFFEPHPPRGEGGSYLNFF